MRHVRRQLLVGMIALAASFAGCVERKSGLMVMLNGDAYLPFLMKMLANPTGPPPTPETIWPDFVRRFFAA